MTLDKPVGRVWSLDELLETLDVDPPISDRWTRDVAELVETQRLAILLLGQVVIVLAEELELSSAALRLEME